MLDLGIYVLVTILSIPILSEMFVLFVGLVSALIMVKTIKYIMMD